MADTIGTLIRREREASGLSQVEVGHRLGVAALTVGKWERGQTVPPIRYHHRLARWLGTPSRAVGDACVAGAAARNS